MWEGGSGDFLFFALLPVTDNQVLLFKQILNLKVSVHLLINWLTLYRLTIDEIYDQ